MTEREKILKDPADYIPEQLMDAIERGIVSYDELMEVDDSVYLQKDKDALTRLFETKEEKREWESIKDHPTEKALRDFIERHPVGRFLQEANMRLEEVCWNVLCEKDKKAKTKTAKTELRNDINTFLKEFPNGPHVPEAQAMLNDTYKRSKTLILINRIRKIEKGPTVLSPVRAIVNAITEEVEKGTVNKDDVLGFIRDDHNIFNDKVILSLVNDKKIITLNDLEQAGIDVDFIEYLASDDKSDSPILSKPNKELTQIPDGFTEFYFWGIPGSGKTCVIGTVLAAAKRGEVCKEMIQTDCQGMAYRDELMKLFSNQNVIELPPRTAVTDTYEMRLILRNRRDSTSHQKKFDNKYYCCAVIDMAGELFTCFYKRATGEQLSQEETQALKNMEKILVKNKSKNRKIHFFVIEYGGEMRTFKGVNQDAYLNYGMEYIRENNIFKEKTDRVYILVTKADRINAAGDDEKEVDGVKDYLWNNYRTFYYDLKAICEKYEINNGELGFIPFSIGEVCFQNYCLTNLGKAESLVYDCFLDTAYAQEEGIVGKLIRSLGK